MYVCISKLTYVSCVLNITVVTPYIIEYGLQTNTYAVNTLTRITGVPATASQKTSTAACKLPPWVVWCGCLTALTRRPRGALPWHVRTHLQVRLYPVSRSYFRLTSTSRSNKTEPLSHCSPAKASG